MAHRPGLTAARVLLLAGCVIGLVSAAAPWWALAWRWQGGTFETITFLYANRISGDLGSLGVPTSVIVSTSAYDFAQTAFILIVTASVAGIMGVFTRGLWRGRLSIFSGLLFAASAVIFVVGLSSILSKQGRSVFSTQTLTFQGSTSTVTTELSLGFYLVIGAASLTLASYMLCRRKGLNQLFVKVRRS